MLVNRLPKNTPFSILRFSDLRFSRFSNSLPFSLPLSSILPPTASYPRVSRSLMSRANLCSVPFLSNWFATGKCVETSTRRIPNCFQLSRIMSTKDMLIYDKKQNFTCIKFYWNLMKPLKEERFDLFYRFTMPFEIARIRITRECIWWKLFQAIKDSGTFLTAIYSRWQN